jgi:glycosyltransferase involved in cell wall biosynthesis
MVAFATEDQELITKMTKRNDIQLFQNGVDRRFYESTPKTKRSPFPSIMFGCSNMKWMQNRESAEILYEKLWPKMKKLIPNAKLYIVGRFAPEIYAHWKSKDVIIAEADIDGLPHDPQYYYDYCWVLAAPILSGGGSRNKFFEAMACKLPIVTTAYGMGGIKIINFKHAIICKYQDIVKQTVNLIKNPQLRIDIGKQANLLIKQKYSYEKSAQGLNKIYDRITKK